MKAFGALYQQYLPAAEWERSKDLEALYLSTHEDRQPP
jgi:hypothetical protein